MYPMKASQYTFREFPGGGFGQEKIMSFESRGNDSSEGFC